MTSMHEFKHINIKDIERVSTTWDLLDDKKSAIRFYKHLFTIYPQTNKIFVKFHNAKVDSLGTNAQALKIAKAMWGSASHIIISVSEGNLKEIYKSIDYLIKIHVNVPKFSPTMFELAVKPMVATIQEKITDPEILQAYVNIFTVIIEKLKTSYPKQK
ncbi:hypothetical protein A3Q56_06067 [Intoshia linei]|uniref:Globin domain-containing protein n=1 Tax=Intoshia linei TaxID=1819745 RepID=A0A177AVU9_9BILA|nr:hypothetical protein A3Q56_06067 [Intoshia linei]